MKEQSASPPSPVRSPVRRGPRPLSRLWPHWPLAVSLALVGLLNIADGMQLPFRVLRQIRALNGLAESLSPLGGSVQVILGAMLVLAAVGLLWRMVSAWALSLLLLALTVGVNIAQRRWGLTMGLQAILLISLFFLKRHFTRKTILATIVFSTSSIFAIIAYGSFGSYFLGKGFSPEIRDMGTAVYFTVTTLSTVAFGDIVPVTPETRWFVVTLIVIGLGVFANAIASALGPKISAEISRFLNLRGKTMELKDHVILIGEGSIALNTVAELKQRGVPFVQIVASKAAAEAHDHQVIEGDATDDAVLVQAGIKRARMVIAAREDDGKNAFITLGAKELNPQLRVMAVASSAVSIRRLKQARADLVFSPAAVGSRLLADLVEGREILPEFRDLLEGHAGKP